MEPEPVSTRHNNEIVTVIIKTEPNLSPGGTNHHIGIETISTFATLGGVLNLSNNAGLKINSDTPLVPTPAIGSKNSAFQPYKAITVLTNLQRGNFKTLHKDVAAPLTFHEKAAKGDLKVEDINESNVDSEDSEGKTALIWACYHGKLPTVKLLIENKANVNYQGLSEETPLMYAATNGRSQTHIEIMNELIEAGAEVDAMDFEGNTALIYATRGNHGSAVTALLAKGASFTHVNENGDSAFNIAVARGLVSAQNALENYLREVIDKNSTSEKILST